MRTAIVEVSESHEECIYSQLKFLVDSGHSVDLIIHEVLRNQIETYKYLANTVHYIKPIEKGSIKKIKQQKLHSKKLKSYDYVIFNTASSSKLIRNLSLLLLLSKVKCIGVLHNSKKLEHSFTQKVISLKVKNYFVLSDAIKNKITSKKGIKTSSFYPIFFPEYKETIEKPKNSVWITIPGRIDWKRRDYQLLISVLRKTKSLDNIKFIILGKLNKDFGEGKKLWDLINKNNLNDYFQLFDSFISNTDYHSYLKASDYLMPLLISSEAYLKYKISGSFNLAFAYKKTLVCKTCFKNVEDLKENSIFYDNLDLENLLEQMDKKPMNVPNKYQQQKWSYHYQQKRYMEFLYS